MARGFAFALLAPTVAYCFQAPTALELIKPSTRQNPAIGADGDVAPCFFQDVAEQVILGSWLDQDDKKQVAHFEPAKCAFARLGESDSARFTRAVFEAGKIRTYAWAIKKEFSFELKDGVLSLTELPGGKTKKYRRLEHVPAEVRVVPLQFGEPKALPQQRVSAIQAQLKQRGRLDQEVRTDPSKLKDMARVDT